MVPIKISNFQQKCIWEKVIYNWLETNNCKFNHHKFNNLLHLHSWDLANIAHDAWDMLQTCNIPINVIKNKYFISQEISVFLEWLNNYLLICKNLHYKEEKSTNNLINKIYYIINNNKDDGDDDYNYTDTIIHKNQFKVECQDFIEEVNKAAQWALNFDINGNIGIIIPNLEKIYLQVDYIFSNHLNSLQFLQPNSYNNIFNTNNVHNNYEQIYYIYNIMNNNTLYNHPAIKIMLLVLHIANCYLYNKNIKYEDFSKLLRSKFIAGSNKELSTRAYADYLIRKEVDYKFSWSYIKNYLSTINLQLVNQSASYNINLFINLLNNFEEIFIKHNLKKTFNDTHDDDDDEHVSHNLHNCHFWVQFVREILQAFGWLTEENVNQDQLISNYLQITFKHLELILNQYQQLQGFLNLHAFEDCHKKIIEILQEPEINEQFLQATMDFKSVNIKQNKSINKCIKIMDLTKAIQIQEKFDYLWICGLNDNNYFNANLIRSFNPFLPIKLQKEYGFFEGSTKINEKYLNYFKNKSKFQFVCSYSLYLDRNKIRPSNLIKSLPSSKKIILYENFLYNSQNLQTNHNAKKNQPYNFSLEQYEDENTTLYQQDNFHGIEFLKLQIACPFQANAKIRLKADQLQIPLPYLNKTFKGEILHKTLADFWNKHIDYNTVISLPKSKIHEDLHYLVTKNFLLLSKFKKKQLNKIILQLEISRMVKLCYNFIVNYDLNRSEFKLLLAEKKVTVKLKQFAITIKIDRIDQLTTGELLIIDYKTSKLLSNNFNFINKTELNIDDPQLLIYSLYDNIKGIILANIRSDQIQLHGLIDSKMNVFNKNILSKKLLIINDWENCFNIIYDKLYNLIYEFKQGIAKVQPKYLNTTCRICELQKFCRIFTK